MTSRFDDFPQAQNPDALVDAQSNIRYISYCLVWAAELTNNLDFHEAVVEAVKTLPDELKSTALSRIHGGGADALTPYFASQILDSCITTLIENTDIPLAKLEELKLAMLEALEKLPGTTAKGLPENVREQIKDLIIARVSENGGEGSSSRKVSEDLATLALLREGVGLLKDTYPKTIKAVSGIAPDLREVAAKNQIARNIKT